MIKCIVNTPKHSIVQKKSRVMRDFSFYRNPAKTS